MRVLVLSSLFPRDTSPNIGIFIKEQLEEIKKLCSVVGVISPIPWFPFLMKFRGKHGGKHDLVEEKWGNIGIYRPSFFMIPRLTIYLNGFFYFISVYIFLRRKKELNDFDILHVHFAYPAGFAGVLLGKILKRRIVLSVRGTDINDFPRNLLLRILIRYTLKNVEEIIAVGNALKEKVSNLGIDTHKITVIPNGVNLNIFKSISKKTARDRLGIDIDSKVILNVGNLVKVKGVEYLLKAFKEIYYSNSICKPVLIIIGTGPLYNTIKKIICDFGISDNVILKRYVTHEEIPLWINSSDVFCLTSLNEGRPNVLYEAIACGIPVVATNVGGVSEIIVSSDLGELVPPRNVIEIKNALERVLNKAWDNQSIRKYALSHSMAKYSEEVVKVYHRAAKPQAK